LGMPHTNWRSSCSIGLLHPSKSRGRLCWWPNSTDEIGVRSHWRWNKCPPRCGSGRDQAARWTSGKVERCHASAATSRGVRRSGPVFVPPLGRVRRKLRFAAFDVDLDDERKMRRAVLSEDVVDRHVLNLAVGCRLRAKAPMPSPGSDSFARPSLAETAACMQTISSPAVFRHKSAWLLASGSIETILDRDDPGVRKIRQEL
jgi:hypothetical protein